MWQVLLVILLGFRPYYLDHEAPAERSARMETVAKAIEYAASRATCGGAFSEWRECSPVYPGDRIELAALLSATAQKETNLARHVHEGHCFAGECDSVVIRGQLIHRARSLWQVHFNPAFREEWPNLLGTATWPTNDAAWAAALVLSATKQRCRTLAGAISGYVGSPDCRWEGAEDRLNLMRRVEAELRAALPGG